MDGGEAALGPHVEVLSGFGEVSFIFMDTSIVFTVVDTILWARVES